MKRNKFSLSNYKLATFDMGKLVPVGWFEALPGDTIQQATSALIRLTPMVTPVMHPLRIRIHHWFVPNRLIWEDWEEFITGGPDGTSAPDAPRIQDTEVHAGEGPDYMGIPVGTYDPYIGYSALPQRAYNMIYNHNYRDQDLGAEVPYSTASGVDSTTQKGVRNVSWEKDYFTTARPWTQKGDEVTIPIQGTAPDQFFDVHDLRAAAAIQRYQEARARYGSRYVEYLRYVGVRNPSDARLQEPEYLGGGVQTIQVSEVLRTGAESGATTAPIGELHGHGIGAVRTNRYRRFFEEHGIVMTLLSVVPKAIYTQNIARGFLRNAKEDYFQKELQFIGEQSMYNEEALASHTTPTGIFGYQERYSDYKYLPSTVAGEFRSTLNTWHLAREFSGDIALNQSFTDCVPTKRCFADTTAHVCLGMMSHSIQARRMMSANPVPKIV